MNNDSRQVAARALDVPLRTKPSNYPEPFTSRMRGRDKRQLGDLFGLANFGVKSSLSGLRGRIHECRGTKLIVTYHPAFLLRDPRQKKEAWQDLKLAMAELGLSVPAR